MSGQDWRWKIGEAIERVRTRYEFIGRKTGAPFLALVYPPEAEAVFLKEWQAQQSTLRPEIDVRSVNVLQITQAVMADIGPDNIVGSLADPMPGSDPQADLGHLWINAVADAVKARLPKVRPENILLSICTTCLSRRRPWPKSKRRSKLPGDCVTSRKTRRRN
jgi:hypothetical protein